jgi:hypothetical protein
MMQNSQSLLYFLRFFMPDQSKRRQASKQKVEGTGRN